MHRIVDQQSALAFLTNQAAYIEPVVYRIKYPEIQYATLIPIDTSAPEWVRTITFFSQELAGQAQWFHHEADDIPQADVRRSKHESAVEMAGIGYSYTLEELGYAMMIPGTNLNSDRAAAARRAYEEFVDRIALLGDDDKDLDGLCDADGVTATQAPADGTGSSRFWSAKTPVQIVRDFNSVLTAIYTESNNVERADTVLLPVNVLQYLGYTQNSTASDTSILKYLQDNNIYTLESGQPLTIRGVRGLESAANDGTGRMVAYRRSPEVLKMHIPMPHKFMPVWQTGPIKFSIPGIFRLGGLEVRLPAAIRYLDNIAAAPA